MEKTKPTAIKWRFLGILIAPFFPLSVYYLGWWGLPLFFLFFFQETLLKNWFGGLDKNNVPEEYESTVAHQKFYRYITFAHVFFVAASLVAVLWVIAHGVEWYWLLFFGVTYGMSGGAAIITAHELIQRREKLESFLGGLMLSFVCYASFKIEHVRGHHVNVSTPIDASSARMGETIYQFVPRAIVRNVYHGFRLEAKRLRNQNKSVISIHNELIWWSLLSLSYALLFYAFGGFGGLGFFLLQSFWAIQALEKINYIEHYGLERQKLPNGRYERVSPLHSWNFSGKFQNAQMLNLMRHSDHHAYPLRRYQLLRHHDESPQLPAGYHQMLFLVHFPKRWFKVMNPRAKAHMERLKNKTENDFDDGAELA